VDDRDTFDRKCFGLHLELQVLVKAAALARERGDTEAVEAFKKKKLEFIATSLDYIYEHLELVDEPTREGWLECAAQLPIMLEEEQDGDEDQ